MDIRGAVNVDLSGADTKRYVIQPYVVRNIPAMEPNDPDTAFGNLIYWFNAPQGVISVYAGASFDWVGTPLDFPVAIDWRLYHGTGCPGIGGVFDQEPAQGSTFAKDTAGLTKEGMLFQIGGLQADMYLLQARIRVAGTKSTQLKATIYARFQPGLQQGAPAITVGSVIG